MHNEWGKLVLNGSETWALDTTYNRFSSTTTITDISQTHNEAQADMIINAKTIMSMRYLQNEIEELKQAILNS